MDRLLTKTRKINRLIQSSAGKSVDFEEMANVLRESITANVYLVDEQGRILGHSLVDEFECDIMLQEVINQNHFPSEYNDWLLGIYHTQSNYEQKHGACVFTDDKDCLFKQKLTTIVPINGGGERLGTLILARFDKEFESSDLLLAEYGATVVGMEILRLKSDKREKAARKKAAVQIALDTLSYSELEAVEHIFAELDGTEGLLVASKIADRVGITRSVIVNALRKFESAGVIESKSLGMKGTHIKILNDYLLEELDDLN
ncbi:GTP-sensing transcriptional pleiotropic repressor CodY [Halobacteroides halobius DSM 5150]|uniref:Global transcriptional regulator CodY n=1 Tax=Halobacteroides halobius (strain ATCC 35273 / DSM 5150 / MD-1) TaxID=748449 RepID=L0K6G4_HALHC|nr:GTP-sensing pleiotropic transcriptional regulator CodY [Halobacteroides halobius]AGB40621.1 GTP-sensing transcriptional pleiotropic repressor CodY [Halobacteroides halobius DSM 5150]